MKIADKVVKIKTEKLIPYHNNPKQHPAEQIDKIASSIKNFGFNVPLVIDKDYEVIAGHGRLEAARKLGLEEIPCIVKDDLTESQIRAYRIADNKTAESGWELEQLAEEFELLKLDDYDLELTQFDKEEIEGIITVPDFQPVGEDEQPRLDEKKKVVCPNCGEEFTPS